MLLGIATSYMYMYMYMYSSTGTVHDVYITSLLSPWLTLILTHQRVKLTQHASVATQCTVNNEQRQQQTSKLNKSRTINLSPPAAHDCVQYSIKQPQHQHNA